jgi:hypothetical protein
MLVKYSQIILIQSASTSNLLNRVNIPQTRRSRLDRDGGPFLARQCIRGICPEIALAFRPASFTGSQQAAEVTCGIKSIDLRQISGQDKG